MKQINILLVAVALLIGNVSFGQVKLGYTNVDYLLSLLPESKQIQSDLETYKKQLDNQIQGKIKEFQTLQAEYERGKALMTDVVRADKEKRLQNMVGEIEDFQKNAEQSMQKKQVDVLKPLLEKVQNAIDKVAKENGYTYIFNSDAGLGTTPFLLHAPEEHNVSDLILKSLGITPPAKTEGTK